MKKFLKSISFCVMGIVVLFGLSACDGKQQPIVNPIVEQGTYYVEDNVLPTISISANDTSGTISWDEGQEIILGEKEYNWTFIPTDDVTYDKATGVLPLTFVNKNISQAAALPSASAISYGQSLSDSTLSGGSMEFEGETVEGSFAWQTATTIPTVADSNATEYPVIFTPSDSSFSNSIIKVKLTINKAKVGVFGNAQTLEKYYDGTTSFNKNNINSAYYRTTFGTSATTNVVVESCAFNASTVSEANKITLTFSLQDSQNFEFLGGNNTCEIPAKINKALVTITEVEDYTITKVYDSTLTATVTEGTHFSVDCEGVHPNVTVLSASYKYANVNSAFNSVTAQIKLADTENFKWGYFGYESDTFEYDFSNVSITRAMVTVSIKRQEGQSTDPIIEKEFDNHTDADVTGKYEISCSSSYEPEIELTYAYYNSQYVMSANSVTAHFQIAEEDYNNVAFSGNNFLTYVGKINKSKISIAPKASYTSISKLYDDSTQCLTDKVLYSSAYNLTFSTEQRQAMNNYVNVKSAIFNSKDVLTANKVTAVFEINKENSQEENSAINNFDLQGGGETQTVEFNASITAVELAISQLSGDYTKLSKVYDGTTAYNGSVPDNMYKVYKLNSSLHEDVDKSLVTKSSMEFETSEVSIRASVTITFAIAASASGNYTLNASIKKIILSGEITHAVATITIKDTASITKVYNNKTDCDKSLITSDMYDVAASPEIPTVVIDTASFNSANCNAINNKVTVTFSISSQYSNYQLAVSSYEIPAAITKAKIYLNPSPDATTTKIYDATTDVLQDQHIQYKCYLETTNIGTSVPSFTIESAIYNSSTVGDKTITIVAGLSEQDSINFEWLTLESNTCQVPAKITKATATVAFKEDFAYVTKLYDGTTDVLADMEEGTHYTITCNTSAVPTLKNLVFTYQSAIPSADTSYNRIDFTYELDDDVNFELDSSSTGTLTTYRGKIEKATITVSAKDAALITKCYDRNNTLNINSVNDTHYQIECNTDATDFPYIYVNSITSDKATIEATKSVVSISITSNCFKLGNTTFEIPTRIDPSEIIIAIEEGYSTIYKSYDGTTSLGNARLLENTHFNFSTSSATAKPSGDDYEITGVFNSANVEEANSVVLTFNITNANFVIKEGGSLTYNENVEIRKCKVSIKGGSTITKVYDRSTTATIVDANYGLYGNNEEHILPNSMVDILSAIYEESRVNERVDVTVTFKLKEEYLSNYEWKYSATDTYSIDFYGKILPIDIIAESIEQSEVVIYTTGSAISLVAENFALPENTTFVSATCQTDIITAGSYAVDVVVSANANYTINGEASYQFDDVSIVVVSPSPEEQPFGAVINHTNAQKEDMVALNASQITSIKEDLRIAYFHTSHGNQIIEGNYAINYMFGNDRSKDFSDAIVFDSYGENMYVDAGQKGSAVEDLGPDVGSLVTATKSFFGDAGQNGDFLFNEGAGLDVNVVIWSWCGELSVFSEERVQQYLDDLNELENYYNGVNNPKKIIFVYMTGHLYNQAYYPGRTDDTAETNTRNNALIRNYCIENNKILFDFEDIESYNPDGVYYGDRCNDTSLYWNGAVAEWWARDWQNSKTENVDWVALDTLRNSTPAQSFEGFKTITATGFSHVEYSIIVLSKAYAFWVLLNHLTTVI